jgi:transcriptional regulator with XRE-family HTH domain
MDENLIGLRIKKHRLIEGITLKELASRCNVTSSLLSQIEKGKASPSLSTLRKIAVELQTTVGNFFDGDEGTKAEVAHMVVRAQQRKRLDDNDANVTMWSLSEQLPFKLMQPMVFTFHGIKADSGFRYQHFGQEFIVVLSGELIVKHGIETYHLKTGDSMYFDSSIPHVFLNAHEGTTELISVNSPPSF